MQILVTDDAEFFGSNMTIANFVSRCLDGKPALSYGDREQGRDFTHLVDVVEAMLEQPKLNAVDEVMNT